jgi:glycine C-acetyltransferase
MRSLHGAGALAREQTPITPVIVGEGRLAMEFSRELFKEGMMATGLAFPTVPEGKGASARS